MNKICKSLSIDYRDLDALNKAVAEYLKVDFVGYNDFESLSKVIGLPSCPSCTSGNYDMLGYVPRARTRVEGLI